MCTTLNCYETLLIFYLISNLNKGAKVNEGQRAGCNASVNTTDNAWTFEHSNKQALSRFCVNAPRSAPLYRFIEPFNPPGCFASASVTSIQSCCQRRTCFWNQFLDQLQASASLDCAMSLPPDQSFVKIGCLLGAFRDVAQGMGLEVMWLTLARVTEEPKANYVTSHRSFPQGKTRTTRKILALIQTLSDSIYHEGYTITDIDLRHMDAVQPGARKTWAMRVAFATEDNRNLIPSSTNANSNGHNSAPVTDPNGS